MLIPIQCRIRPTHLLTRPKIYNTLHNVMYNKSNFRPLRVFRKLPIHATTVGNHQNLPFLLFVMLHTVLKSWKIVRCSDCICVCALCSVLVWWMEPNSIYITKVCVCVYHKSNLTQIFTIDAKMATSIASSHHHTYSFNVCTHRASIYFSAAHNTHNKCNTLKIHTTITLSMVTSPNHRLIHSSLICFLLNAMHTSGQLTVCRIHFSLPACVCSLLCYTLQFKYHFFFLQPHEFSLYEPNVLSKYKQSLSLKPPHPRWMIHPLSRH